MKILITKIIPDNLTKTCFVGWARTHKVVLHRGMFDFEDKTRHKYKRKLLFVSKAELRAIEASLQHTIKKRYRINCPKLEEALRCIQEALNGYN